MHPARKIPSPVFLILLLGLPLASHGQINQAVPSGTTSSSEQVQVGPPTVRHTDPPAASDTLENLEKRGDELRAEKNYLDALDYYRAALPKVPRDRRSALLNKIGITEMFMQRDRDSRKDLEQAIKADRKNADAHNNLGVIHYKQKDYSGAIKLYRKAIALRADSASFYSNLGTAYFARQEFENATQAYSQAVQLDPDVFERISRNGITAQMASPADRARYFFVLARLYASTDQPERALQYLRRSMEEGYKDIGKVYSEKEFAQLRKDPRFTELMAAKPAPIPE